jgi:hypothetical protein
VFEGPVTSCTWPSSLTVCLTAGRVRLAKNGVRVLGKAAALRTTEHRAFWTHVQDWRRMCSLIGSRQLLVKDGHAWKNEVIIEKAHFHHA